MSTLPRKRTSIPNPRISLWSVLVLVISLIAIYVLLSQIKQLSGSITILRHAVIWWVLAGLAMSALSFYAAAFTQYVAGDYIGSFKKITILQLTGAFINHFLPFNFGSSGLTARYYWTLGKPPTKALALSAIPITVGALLSALVVALVSPLTLRHVAQHTISYGIIFWVIASIAVLFIVSFLIPPLHRHLVGFAREVIASFANLKVISQLPGIILGCLALTAILAAALLFSVYATHASISFTDAFTIFIFGEVVQSVTPTPGGLGGVEASLAFGLTSVGVSLSQAVAAALVFRFIYFWMPIIPGIWAFREAGRWGLLEPRGKQQETPASLPSRDTYEALL